VKSCKKWANRLPDFIVIGAMKCATTTLHEQLARQSGLFMSHLKEPNFFSDDDVHARGIDWYRSLFDQAEPDQLLGESSTHYTKLPTHPHTVERMVRALPRVKLIYVMRHPIDRLTSHYLHELTVGRIANALEQAIDSHQELLDYGRYSMQLEPYLQAYGPGSVLPVFFDRLVGWPDEELDRIGEFLGVPGSLRWDPGLAPQNVGSERLRHSRVRDVLVRSPGLTAVRRKFIPRPWVEHIKSIWKVGIDPPHVPPRLEIRLCEVFDRDLARLGSWLGVALDCDNFREVTRAKPLSWTDDRAMKAIR
jgi:hypothetical protein